MKDKKTPRRYAKALLAWAAEKNRTEQVFEDLMTVQSTMKGSAEFRAFLINPIVKETEKHSVLQALFKNKIGMEVSEFLKLLCAKGRENFLAEMIDMFLEMRREGRGILRAEVTSVVDLNATQVADLTKNLRQLTGKTPELSFRKDPGLIGGFLVKYGDRVIDGSVKRQLEKLRERFEELGMN